MKKKDFSLLLFMFYSLIFIAMAFACFFLYFCFDRTFFTTYDGRVQHIAALTYYGTYIRNIAHSFVSGRFAIPLWDFALGFGADIIATLHYYAIGDPLTLLSAFVKPERTEILYNFLIFLRLYLAGFCFLLYCRHHRFDSVASLCGAIVYVFSGFSFFCAARHPFFINPMIYFPLMLFGMDCILEKKDFRLFALAVFLSCASSFYFFYMQTILVFIYAIIRFFFKFEEPEHSKIWGRVGIALAGYAIGLCMAMFLFLPSVLCFLTSARTEEGEPLSFLYRLNYYMKFFLGTVAPSTFGSYSVLGFAAPVLPLMILLFQQKDKLAKELKLFILIGIIFFLFPLFGCIFNGGGYATNRWCFAFSFAASIGTACILPIAWKKTLNEMRLPFVLCALLSVTVFLSAIISKDVARQFALPYAVLLFCILVLSVIHWKNRAKRQTYFCLICISAIFNANFRFSEKGLNYLENCIKKEDYKEIKNEMLSLFPIQYDGFFRVDTSYLKSLNAPCASGIFGTTYYWSLVNGLLNDFYVENNVGSGNALSCGGLKNYPNLYGLFNIKYILADETLSAEESSELSDTGIRYLNYNIYENKNFVPFGSAQTGEHLENMRLEANKISAEITLEKSQDIFLSIPYSKFWTAKIDGDPAELLLSNVAFTELRIPAGSHIIELRYKNKAFYVGLTISILALAFFILCVVRKDMFCNVDK